MPHLSLSSGYPCCPIPCCATAIFAVPGRPPLPFCTPSLLPPVVAMFGSATPKAKYMSAPRPLEPVQVDKMTLKLYPVIDSTMKPPERAHAFQINKTALPTPGINCQMMLSVLSMDGGPRCPRQGQGVLRMIVAIKKWCDSGWRNGEGL